MKTIYKYTLSITDVQTVSLPSGANILHIGAQRGELCLWAWVDPTASPIERTLIIVGTGNPVPALELRYIWTVALGPYVWHIFEEIRNED